jgi:hypothetical protein
MALGKEVGYAAKANVVSKLRVATLAILLAAGVLGCSRQAVQPERLPNGTFSFKCDEELWVCLSHVRDVCKDGPYEVLSGHEEPRMHGVDESRVESHRSRAIVRCLRPGQEVKLASPAPVHAPRVVHAVPGKPLPPRAPRPTPVPRACVPGATQACVGPAACTGGQACVADGSGFGPCDCGSE